MGFRDKAGAKRYVRAKTKPVDRALSWSLATVQGRKTVEASLTFVPYSTNAAQMSRWGAFDFDSHDGNGERARRLTFAAFALLRHCEVGTILENSGSSGWHLWAISADFKPVSHWIRLLKNIARDIGATVESGICEIFPSDTLSRGFGKGLRAPGSWNPGTNKFSEIYWENTSCIIDRLPTLGVSGKSLPIGEVDNIYSDASPIEKKVSLSPPSFFEFGRLIGGVSELRVERPATRREQLKKLACTAFRQVADKVAQQLARAQFTEKTVATNADEAEHMRDFAGIWEWLGKNWMESLAATERDCFAVLVTDAERGAFRIVHNFACKAAKGGAFDFPIARDNLAARIDLTPEGAGLLRRKFVRLGIIQETVPYRANVSPARFRWLLTPALI